MSPFGVFRRNPRACGGTWALKRPRRRTKPPPAPEPSLTLSELRGDAIAEPAHNSEDTEVIEQESLLKHAAAEPVVEAPRRTVGSFSGGLSLTGGASIAASSAAETTVEESASSNTESSSVIGGGYAEPTKKSNFLLIAVCIGALVVVAGGGAFYFHTSAAGSKAAAPSAAARRSCVSLLTLNCQLSTLNC